MSTDTLRQLRHNFAAVEAAARKSPVKITRRGKVIGVFSTRFSSVALVDKLAAGGER